MRPAVYSLVLSASWASASIFPAWKRAEADQSCEVYGVQTGDSCWSIMKQTNVTYAQLISWNPEVDKQCLNITALEGQNICISNPEGDYAIPSNSEGSPTIVTTTAAIPDPTPNGTEDGCGEYHLVAAGEDCGTFTIKYGITVDDFIFLNPQVWENCTNVYLGYYYCVRPVGYISTYPGYLPTTSTETFVATEMTAAPDDYDIDWLDRSAEVAIPLANDTRKDCETYLYLTNITDTPLIADCWSMAMVCGITSEEIVLWNPSLAQSSSNTSDHTYNYPCTLSESVSYCVALEEATEAAQADDEAPPSPRAVGEIENCTAWYNPESYETCESVLNTNWLDFDDFYAMNPSVSSDCSGLVVGTYYCISTNADGSPPSDDDEVVTTATGVSSTAAATATGVTTPSPVQSGMVSGCDDFYLVQADDGCWAIANDNGIVLADFYAWNPAIQDDCSGLQASVYVCVGVSASASSTTEKAAASTTTSTAGNATPTPVQDDMVSGCKEFYFVQTDDGCWAIANSNGIELADLYEWNPAVQTDCSGLQANVYVCIGV